QFGVGTHDSLFTQYVRYLGDLAHGNLGISISNYPTRVVDILGNALAWTLVLVGGASIMSFVLGTGLGARAAWKRASWLENVTPLVTFFQAIPYFWSALIILFVLAFTLNWFPLTSGYSFDVEPGFNADFILSAAYHAILPAFTIVLSSIAGWMLGM